MSRFESTLSTQVAGALGDHWKVSVDHSALWAEHCNGTITLYRVGGDGRKTATSDDVVAALTGLLRKLRGEIPKYTPEWRERATLALKDWPSDSSVTR